MRATTPENSLAKQARQCQSGPSDELRGGDAKWKADEARFSLDYSELRRLASAYLQAERRGHTLQPTALVHEAFIRISGQRAIAWKNRAHFFAVFATTMRRILVEYARAKKSAKRGGGARRIPLDEAVASFEDRSIDLLMLDDAVSALPTLDPRKGRVAEMRLFAGLGVEDIATALEVATRTVKRDWAVSKAWLFALLTDADGRDA